MRVISPWWVLDLRLGDGFAVDLVRRRRGEGDSAMVLALASGELEDRVRSVLLAGANDFLPLPCATSDLPQRIAALCRRGQSATRFRFGSFVLDVSARALTDGRGCEVPLTPTELELLICFAQNSGRALHRETILDTVWGRDVVVEPRTVDNFVSSLRRKLGWRPGAPYRFKTVRGFGYRFDLSA